MLKNVGNNQRTKIKIFYHLSYMDMCINQFRIYFAAVVVGVVVKNNSNYKNWNWHTEMESSLQSI